MVTPAPALIRGKRNWFLPITVYRKHAADPKNRKDDRLYININKNREWLDAYEGDAGIRLAFARLLG